MAIVRFTLNDGTILEGDGSAPWTVREQLEWERHFRQSFATVFKAIAAEARGIEEQLQALQDGAQVEDIAASHFRVEWILWFAWYRLRGKVAGRFEQFIDLQLADYEFLDPAPEEEPPAQPEEPAADGGLDPTPGDSTPALSPAQ